MKHENIYTYAYIYTQTHTHTDRFKYKMCFITIFKLDSHENKILLQGNSPSAAQWHK